jgi:hypothetical protein
MNCINIQSKEFINLLDKTGLQPSVLEAKIISYQNNNGIDSWPTQEYFNNNVNFQLTSTEGQIASEKAIRDLAARMSDRIGMPIEFESDRTKEYKGKIENNVAYVNLAYATLDTPIHEILGHPIIRAIKNIENSVWQVSEVFSKDNNKYTRKPEKDYKILATFKTQEEAIKFHRSLPDSNKADIKSVKTDSQLYQNLVKELETGRGKEVLDRIKKDYNLTGRYELVSWEEGYASGRFSSQQSVIAEGWKIGDIEIKNGIRYYKIPIKYTLEEQQEEAIVELLGLMTAEKLDNVKDGKLISLLKRLLKEMKQFVRSLINQKEVEIDKLPDNMTIGDISDLLAYSNSKLILPGYEVEYTTPDNMKFKTYAEASNHISELAKSVEDVNLDNVELGGNQEVPENLKWEFENQGKTYKKLIENKQWKISDDTGNTQIVANQEYKGDRGGLYWDGENYYHLSNTDNKKTIIPFNEFVELFSKIKQFGANKDKLFQDRVVELSEYDQEKINPFKEFINKNKEYEQSKEIIEEWKKVNNIQYNPEEIYSRGQEFSSVVGAYSSFDVNLMMQNLLQHIEDNEKAGGKFAISAYTKPVDKTIGHLEGGGGKIKFKLYPQSKDILWAANVDVYSGSVWDAGNKINKDKKSELLGVSYTKYPSTTGVYAVQPNLADIVDNLAHHHNELGIVLTGNNFRLEYDDNIPNQTKKIINGINSILDQKYGKLVKPEIAKQGEKSYTVRSIDLDTGTILKTYNFKTKEEALTFIKDNDDDAISYGVSLVFGEEALKGIQPTQTNETLKEDINSIKRRLSDLTEEETADVQNKIKEGFITDEEEHNNYMLHLLSKRGTSFNSQALINTKIAKLKEVAKKYPRSLIRSEVVRTREYYPGEFLGFAEDELPFQKISKKDSPVFFQQLDMFKNVLTVAQREYIKEKVKSTKMYKGVLTWNPKFNNFDVKNLLEKDASDFNRQLQKELKINFLPLKLEPKKITNFSKSNATYGGKRTQFYVAKLMATDGTFPQIDTVKELRLPDPKITDQMKGILSDLGISLVNWEAYSAWYEKQYGKPLLANAIADMTNKVIAMRESGEKIDTLPEEVSHFILYTMRDIPWVKNLLSRVDETPEWQEHSENYTKFYNGDMDMVRLEVLGKILAKSFVNNGEGVSKKWYRYIEELWQRFLSLFGRDNIRRRMDYLAAEVVFNPSMKKKIAVNLNRFGITPYDNVVFANLDVEDFLDTDVLNKYSKIVEKSVDALADSLRRDLNSKAASVGARQKLYEYMLQQINKGNHTISMAYLVSSVETESNSVLRRLLQFEDDFQKERSAADFNTFARILRSTNDFTLTYKDTFTELESALMLDDLKLKSQIKVFEDMEDLNNDEKLLFKNLKQRKVLINEVLTSIGNSKKVMTMMEQNYQKYAKNIFMNVINPMLEERFAKGQYTEEQKEAVIENLKLQLDEAKDIDAINKWMQSMAESGDDVLGIADRLTKDTIEKAKMKSISVGKDLIDLASEYEAATGSRDTSFMYGKNDAGILTGDYITEIDDAKYVTNKALFYDELNTRYKKLSEEAVDDDAKKGLLVKKKKEIANWLTANTEVLNQQLREQLKKRKKEAIYAYYISNPDSESQVKLAESKYQEWLLERENYNVDSGYTRYGKEFIIPKKEVYASKQYKKLNSAQKEFHTKYMLMYKAMKEYMPDHIYNANTAIQIRKDGMERILSSENKFKEFTKLLEEGFTRKVDDTERGMTDEDLSSQEKLNKRLLKNSSGRRIYTVPIHHLMKLEDSSELSTDAVSAMLAFIDTSTRYEGISEIADSLEVFGDILKYRKMITTDTLNRSSVESEGGNAYARYMKYLEMVIYGKTKNDEGVIPGTTIDVAKLIDNINNYTAMNNLAFNMYAGVANVGLGNILMREEAFAKQYVKHEDLNFAFKEYSKQLPGILNEVGEVKSSNKLRLLLEYTDALQDHENRMRDLGWGKEKHQRMVNRSHMYFMNHMGEHQMQSRMMLALMHNTKLKDSEGKDITMYDAFEVVNNRIVIKDGINNIDGSKFSEKQIISFNIRMKAINQRLHGIYNETDKSIIQQYALGRAAIMFRKWVVPGINRRFEKEYYNWSDMETREGFYRTSAKFLIGIIKEAKDTKNLMKAYENNLSQLTDSQKANMARAVSEVAYFFLLLASGTALMMFAKGIDDDDWLLKHSANHLAHATLRIKSEMGFYVFPSDFLKLLKSPAASINTLEKILNITKFIDYSSFIDEEKTFLRRYQSGRYEDELYASVWAKGMIPTWRTISDIAYSEDKLKFLTE